MIVRASGEQGQILPAADILLRCFESHENAKLGLGYAAAVIRSFSSEPRRSLHLALDDGRVVGFASGEPAMDRPARYRSLRGAAALAMLQKPWLVADPSVIRMAISRFRGDEETGIPAASWFLAVIAVAPESQRRGRGRELLRAFEEEGRRRGFLFASLEVEEGNARARRLYESEGWEPRGTVVRGRLRYERSLSS